MKVKIVLILTCLVFNNLQAQTNQVTLFKGKPFVVFNLKEVNLYNASGGNDSSEVKIMLSDLGANKYNFKVIEAGPTYTSILYPAPLLMAVSIEFKCEGGRVIPNIDTLAVYKTIKAFNDLRYGADTIRFGEYYPMMSNPMTLIGSVFMPTINLIGPYINNKIANDSWRTMIPGMTDSSIANCVRTIQISGNSLNVDVKTTIDVKETQAYLFKKQIELNGERIREIFKETDMIYLKTTVNEVAKGKMPVNSAKFIISEITQETRKNYGNPEDVINIKRITLE